MLHSKHVKEAYDSLQKLSNEYARSSNKQYSDLVKHIGLFTSVLLPLVGLFIVSDRYTEISSLKTNITAFITVISLCGCLFVAFVSYIKNGEFYIKLSREASKAQEKILQSTPENEEEEDELIESVFKDVGSEKNTSSSLVFMSSILIVVALGSFVYLMYQILFSDS